MHFRTTGFIIPALASDRMVTEGKWQICNHCGASCLEIENSPPREATQRSLAGTEQGRARGPGVPSQDGDPQEIQAAGSIMAFVRKDALVSPFGVLKVMH